MRNAGRFWRTGDDHRHGVRPRPYYCTAGSIPDKLTYNAFARATERLDGTFADWRRAGPTA